MKLLTLNVDNGYFLSCVEHQTSGKGDDVLFVDWLPTTGHISDDVANQIQIVESTPDDVRMIIFDRHSSMTDEEVDFFVKRKAILLEPVIKQRYNFLYMPYYIDRLDLPLHVWDDERPFHFGFKGKSLVPQAERLLLKSIKHVNDIRVGVSVKEKLPDDRYKILRDVMSFGNYSWNRFNTVLVTGCESDCYRGVLPDIRSHLKNGVVPLVDSSHKWFHSLFKDFIIFEMRDVSWYRKMYQTIGYGMIDQLYNNIQTYHPEMFTENFVEVIVSLGGGP